MREIEKRVIDRVRSLMESGEISRVLGWEKGEPEDKWQPAVFNNIEELDGLVYGKFAGTNLSKMCVKYARTEGVTAVLLKPCDTLSFDRLIKEHRLDREKFYIIGVGCKGMEDERGLLMKCAACKGKVFAVYDEIIDDAESKILPDQPERMAGVREIEAMTPAERFAFWKKELSRCIRCNACRNVCPACTCIHCVFDDPASPVSSKTSFTAFDDSLYHIVRAFHVAGRCTDCGECSRACPQSIPLHLINRKIIKDMTALYGENPVGERTALTSYDVNDPDPGDIFGRGDL